MHKEDEEALERLNELKQAWETMIASIGTPEKHGAIHAHKLASDAFHAAQIRAEVAEQDRNRNQEN